MRKALFFLGILSDSDVEWLIRNGDKVRVSPNTVLVHQGKPTDTLWFVLDGAFEVYTSKLYALAILKAGEVIGEISFVDSRAPTASVKSIVESQVGSVSRLLLAAKLKDDLGFSSRFYRALATFMADRLRTTVGNLGTGAPELQEDVEDVDEVAAHLMDNIAKAGTRFSEMQRRNWGAGLR